jgi:hypothetical protein
MPVPEAINFAGLPSAQPDIVSDYAAGEKLLVDGPKKAPSPSAGQRM